MIKQLKRQLMLITMGSFTVIIAALIAFIAIVPAREKKAQIRTALESYSQQERPQPNDILPDSPDLQAPPIAQNPPINLAPQDTGMFRDFGGNVIAISTDSSNTVSSWSSNRDDYYDDDTIQTIVSLIDGSNAEFDKMEGYYFLRHKTPTGFSYTVLDATSSVMDERRTTMWATIGGAAAWILLFMLSLKLVGMMTRPIQESFDRQNRFIADAGHELKTPIAVIQANADVLENEQGHSRWLSYIKTETHRMDGLVKDLMFLTSMGSVSKCDDVVELSSIVEGAALPFEALAFEKGMSLKVEVQQNVAVKGNSFQLEKLVSILLSNAVKYGEEGGSISVSLYDKHKNVVLKVRNTGVGIQECDKEMIFERFYRVDKARSRADGSYGLGLAMAKEISDIHNGKLSVESEYGNWIEFTFEMKGI